MEPNPETVEDVVDPDPDPEVTHPDIHPDLHPDVGPDLDMGSDSDTSIPKDVKPDTVPNPDVPQPPDTVRDADSVVPDADPPKHRGGGCSGSVQPGEASTSTIGVGLLLAAWVLVGRRRWPRGTTARCDAENARPIPQQSP